MDENSVPILIKRNQDIVYLSPWLKKTYPNFFHRLTNLFEKLLIQWFFLSDTNDIWCRDFMPFPIDKQRHLLYRYYPDYLLKKESDKCYITNPEKVCKALNLPCSSTDLIIDGGNMVKAGDYLIMTEKIFHENAQKTKTEIIEELEKLTDLKLLLLPWDQAERYGHSDGIVRPINNKSVLMTNYEDFDKDIAQEIKKRLKEHFNVISLKYDVPHLDPRSWAYINYLEVGNTIIIPALDIPEDRQALKQIKKVFPHKQLAQIQMQEIIEKGGALNCITWTMDWNFFLFLHRIMHKSRALQNCNTKSTLGY